MIQNNVKNEFVSCIKVNGVPILPPLITAERRIELQKLKHQAMLLEDKLKYRRNIKESLDELLNFRPLTAGSVDFDSTSHIEALETERRIPNPPNLTPNITDVSQYNEEGVKTLDSPASSSNDSPTIPTVEEKFVRDDTKICSSPKPRLIRSNSYTVDTPSPSLLAHLQKQGEKLENNKLLSETRGWSSLDNNHKDEDSPKSPTIEVIHTDITIQQVTLNPPFIKDPNLDEDAKTVDEIDPQLLEILKNIPPQYTERIIRLMSEPRRTEPQKPEYNDSELLNDSVMSMSSQSVYYTLSNSEETIQSPKTPSSLKLIDLEAADDVSHTETVQTVNRQLFPSETPPKHAKEHWASSKIQAFVKGYLVRRLLRTEHVQNLIQTIKDALLCALQLHKAEQIDEADVELHRRLIQQVTAACYAFHDIFFEFDKKKQMSLIASDRHRRIEKAKRPVSAPSSSRSSTRRRTISNSSKSLTKV